MVCKTPSASAVTGIEIDEPQASDAPATDQRDCSPRCGQLKCGGHCRLGMRRRELRDERSGSEGHATPGQTPSQQVASTRQTPLDSAQRTAQPAGGLVVSQALEIAKYDRSPVLLRQVADFLMKPGLAFQRHE